MAELMKSGKADAKSWVRGITSGIGADHQVDSSDGHSPPCPFSSEGWVLWTVPRGGFSAQQLFGVLAFPWSVGILEVLHSPAAGDVLPGRHQICASSDA